MSRLQRFTGKCCLLAAAFVILTASGCRKPNQEGKPRYHIEWLTPHGTVDHIDVEIYERRYDAISFIRAETQKEEVISGTITIKEN